MSEKCSSFQCQKQGRKKNIEEKVVSSQILRYFKNQYYTIEHRYWPLKDNNKKGLEDDN